MTLKQFVSQSLTEIIEGIRESQQDENKLLAQINPLLSKDEMPVGARSDISAGVGQKGYSPHTLFVEFDVAVLATSDSKTKAGFSLFVAAFAGGATTEAGDIKTAHNRIKFTIPLRLRDAGEYREELAKG
jgi:hypothetical protein